ncbi:ras GEF [Peniophora sp. CONT]|nr:ras GEF [Peniophora sp. CONT]
MVDLTCSIVPPQPHTLAAINEDRLSKHDCTHHPAMPSLNILCLLSTQQTCDCCGGRGIHPAFASAPPTLLDFKPALVAQQLTLLEWALFSKIEPTNIINRGRKVQTHSEGADISTVIDISNKLANWVPRTVLGEEDVDKRARIVEHFIDIADNCRKLTNLSSMAALYAGLHAPAMTRLKQTWGRVGKKHFKSIAKCCAMIHPYLVPGKYEGMHRNVKPPCVPFIGAFQWLL